MSSRRSVRGYRISRRSEKEHNRTREMKVLWMLGGIAAQHPQDFHFPGAIVLFFGSARNPVTPDGPASSGRSRGGREGQVQDRGGRVANFNPPIVTANSHGITPFRRPHRPGNPLGPFPASVPARSVTHRGRRLRRVSVDFSEEGRRNVKKTEPT